MIYLTASNGTKIIVLESANLEELKKGKPAVSPDKSVLICWTADPVWLADRLLDSGGDSAKVAAAIDEAAKRPEKPGPRPFHETHTKDFREHRREG